MVFKSKVYQNGIIVIPKTIRDTLQIKTDDEIVLEVVIKKNTPVVILKKEVRDG